MVTLDTSFMGLKLKNPIIAASGPWCGNAAGIQAAIDAGAGAVITETIAQENGHRCAPRILYHDGKVMSISLHGNCSLEQWESEMEKIHKGDCKLIAGIRGGTPSELAYIARKVERMGVDAVQLDLYAPIGPMIFGLNDDATQLTDHIRAVKGAVSIPVLVRLPHYVADNARFMRALEDAHADGVTMCESIRGIIGVDIENAVPQMPTYGAYTGRHLLPVTLASIAALSQVSDLAISAAGGLSDAHNAIEAIMLGATTVQLGSALMLNGYERIREVVDELAQWMNQHHYHDICSLRSRALSGLYSYEELDTLPHRTVLSPGPECKGCDICKRVCLHNAISISEEGMPQHSDSRCEGCGLCGSVCPHQLIHME